MKILNFGSLNIDYVYSVDHFVKKGETIASTMLNTFSGGKGLNQSIALKKAGLNVYHSGAIGTDGLFLEQILKDIGVNTSFLYKLESMRTGNAIIQNDSQGDNCIILYGGANNSITTEMIDEVLSNFTSDDWLILQNEISNIPYIVEKAHKKGMKIILNPSPINDNIFKINLDYINYFILNEIEAKALVGEYDDKYVLLENLNKKFPNAEIVLTLGENGSIYGGKQGIIEQNAYKVEVVDTTAAGDTFTGYYIASILQDISVKHALDIATKASALAVSRKGAAPSIPNKNEVLLFNI